MANKNAKPPKEHMFKKGNKANPLGAGAHNPITREFKKLTLESFRDVIRCFVEATPDQVKKYIDDSRTTMLERGIINSLAKAVREGDWETINAIVSRVVGKIPDEVKITADNMNTNVNTNITNDQLKQIVKDLKDNV